MNIMIIYILYLFISFGIMKVIDVSNKLFLIISFTNIITLPGVLFLLYGLNILPGREGMQDDALILGALFFAAGAILSLFSLILKSNKKGEEKEGEKEGN